MSNGAQFRAIYAEIKRIDQLRTSDQLATSTALTAAEKATAAALTAAKEAVNKAEANQGNVNATQNEFRGALKDQAATLMPRTETESLIRELRGLITTQDLVIAGLRSRIDVGPPSLSTLQARSDENIGRREGAIDQRTLIFAVMSLVLGIAGYLAGRQ